VFTVREYPTRDRFQLAVDAVTDTGINEHVVEFPRVKAFAEDGSTDESAL